MRPVEAPPVRTALPKILIVLIATLIVAMIGSGGTLGEALESPAISTAMSLVAGGGIGALLIVLMGGRAPA
jgi:hypothetical protein